MLEYCSFTLKIKIDPLRCSVHFSVTLVYGLNQSNVFYTPRSGSESNLWPKSCD